MNFIPTMLMAAAASEVWHSLFEILLLLGLAMILGTLAERFRQSAIVGYLIAGAIIGPGTLGLVSSQQELFNIAELGVALLLFTIGLEFAPKRLLSFGKTPLMAGVLQVSLTLMLGCIASWLLGMTISAALVIGAMLALSSTACVLRILTDRAEIDSPYGKISLGILLTQDVAVVPLMLLVTVLASGGTFFSILWQLAATTASAAVLIAVFYVLFNYVAPKLLELKTWRRNRDFPILLAVVMAMGAAWVAHRFVLSPALGAFVAGVLLAISPFAVQIRADIEPVKTILVTLFFASVGMFGDASWLLQNLGLVCGIVLAIVIGKTLLVAVVARISGGRTQFAVASALCLAQVGEFSFVLATIARGGPGDTAILSETAFKAIVSATIFTLLITPYLIAVAPRLGAWFEGFLRGCFRTQASEASNQGAIDQTPSAASRRDLIFIIGFGPAGQRAAEDLIASHLQQLVVIELNPDNIEIAKRYGLATQIGDATQSEILEHAGIQRANLVIITVPSPASSRKLVHMVRHHASNAIIFARSRYHLHRWELVHAGAHFVVDEEDRVGHQLAAEALIVLNEKPVD